VKPIRHPGSAPKKRKGRRCFDKEKKEKGRSNKRPCGKGQRDESSRKSTRGRKKGVSQGDTLEVKAEGGICGGKEPRLGKRMTPVSLGGGQRRERGRRRMSKEKGDKKERALG